MPSRKDGDLWVLEDREVKWLQKEWLCGTRAGRDPEVPSEAREHGGVEHPCPNAVTSDQYACIERKEGHELLRECLGNRLRHTQPTCLQGRATVRALV